MSSLASGNPSYGEAARTILLKAASLPASGGLATEIYFQPSSYIRQSPDRVHGR